MSLFADDAGNAAGSKPKRAADVAERATVSPSPISLDMPTAKAVTLSKPTVVITDAAIEQLGNQQSTQLSRFSQGMLAQVRTSDVDQFGDQLNQLIGCAKGLDPTKFSNKGLVNRIRGLVGGLKERMLAEYQTVEGRMNALVAEMDKSGALHTRRISDLEDMYNANYQTHQDLEKCVEQGEQMLLAIQAQLDEEKQVSDSFAAQRVKDIQDRYERLEKRIDDIKRMMLLAKQTAPEIRLLQDNARVLAEKFKDVKNVTIPAWQNAFTLYMIQMEQKKSAAVVNGVHDATDAAFKLQADQLRSSTNDIAQAKQRSVVSLETLEHVQQQLIGSFDDCARIAEEGRRARKAAEPKLKQLERQLIERFVPNNSTPSNQ